MPVYNPLNLIFGDVLSPARAATLETQWQLARERARPLGGIPDVGVTSTSYVDVPGVVIVRIDEPATAQLHVTGDLELAAGDYKLQTKIDAAPDHVIVYGAALVTR
jgi:hypothetical protein